MKQTLLKVQKNVNELEFCRGYTLTSMSVGSADSSLVPFI